MNLLLTGSDDARSHKSVEFLRQKSGIHKSQMQAAKFSDILLVDDSKSDINALSALLRTTFGRDTGIRVASSIMRAVNLLIEQQPQLILLDDILPPRDRADTSIPQLRKAGYLGPIIVISGEMTRLRRLHLLHAGAASVIHKDDLNTSSLAEALVPADAMVQTESSSAEPTDRGGSDEAPTGGDAT